MRRTRRWRACISVAAALAMAAGLGAGALAVADDEDEWDPWDLPPAVDDDGDGDDDDDDDDDDDAGGSPGEVTVPDVVAPCWLSYTDYAGGAPELVVGHMVGQVNTSGVPVSTAEAYFRNGRCGWGELVGSVTSDFTVRLSSWYAMDRTARKDSYFELDWEMRKYDDSSTCSGGSTTLATITFPPGGGGWSASETEWNEPYRYWGSAYARGITPPASGEYDSYWYKLTAYSEVPSSGDDDTAYAEGCFTVYRP